MALRVGGHALLRNASGKVRTSPLELHRCREDIRPPPQEFAILSNVSLRRLSCFLDVAASDISRQQRHRRCRCGDESIKILVHIGPPEVRNFRLGFQLCLHLVVHSRYAVQMSQFDKFFELMEFHTTEFHQMLSQTPQIPLAFGTGHRGRKCFYAPGEYVRNSASHCSVLVFRCKSPYGRRLVNDCPWNVSEVAIGITSSESDPKESIFAAPYRKVWGDEISIVYSICAAHAERPRTNYI